MKYLFAMLGAPGTGKTTYLKTISNEIFGDDRILNHVVSPDNIRAMVQSPVAKPDGGFGYNFKLEKLVWEIVNSVLDSKVQRGETIFVDATHSRNSAISAYKKYSDQGYRVYVIDMRGLSLNETLERNKKRDAVKFVPEDRIKTMYDRIEVIDIPKWVTVIKPEELPAIFDSIQHDWSEFDHLNFVGDIHGCADELRSILDGLPKNENGITVFLGDYFDRGPKIVETYKILMEYAENNKVLFLLGNHEEPLADLRVIYAEAQAVFEEFLKNKIESFNGDYDSDPIARILLGMIRDGWKSLDKNILELQRFPEHFEEFKGMIKSMRTAVKNTSKNAMKQFILSDITYQELSQFKKRLAQLCYIKYGTANILATHGGLADIPTLLTPSADMIRGVGTYDDAQLCAETFTRLNPNCISIHGHRNTTNLPIQNTACTFNINGDVELGLRAVTIHKDLSIETTEVPPKEETMEFLRMKRLRSAQKLKAKKLSLEEETAGLIQLFQDHKYVDVKKLDNDIAAINFTRKAFEGGKWDEITLKARGLFMDISQDKDPEAKDILARGYEKFFNLGEKHGITERDIPYLNYPIRAYEKANGYLGILSVDARGDSPEWIIASKSTTEGDFANNFREMIKPKLTKTLMGYLKDWNLTLVFEVIDPFWDPHIEEYQDRELVLLDAIYNELDFKKLDFEALDIIINMFHSNGVKLRVKNLLGVINTTQEFNILKNKLDCGLLSETGIEGAVFEDSSEEPIMFKYKTHWYKFWKYIRSMRDRIYRQLYKGKEYIGPMTIDQKRSHRERLHSHEEINAFETLVNIIENDPESNKLGIPDIRRRILKDIQAKVEEV